MNKILILGLGSIGQRHAKALLKLGETNIAALRTGKGQKEVDPELHIIKVFRNEEDAFSWGPTHLIISNPTSLHVQYIKTAIDKGLNFFVEKPISNDLSEINSLGQTKFVNGTVGFNLRFHGMVQCIKKILTEERFGKIITAKLHVGQYLPSWHPYEDYRKAYYSIRELGGGALRTLSHELDLVQFFFGKVKNLFAKVERLSELEIDVDDVVNVILKTEKCRQVNLHINFLDPVVRRQGFMYFSKGAIHYDLIRSELVFTNNQGVSEVIYSVKEDYNKQYEAQMKDFLSKDNSGFGCTFSEGIEVQRIIDGCLKSNTEKKEICLD